MLGGAPGGRSSKTLIGADASRRPIASKVNGGRVQEGDTLIFTVRLIREELDQLDKIIDSGA